MNRISKKGFIQFTVYGKDEYEVTIEKLPYRTLVTHNVTALKGEQYESMLTDIQGHLTQLLTNIDKNDTNEINGDMPIDPTTNKKE